MYFKALHFDSIHAIQPLWERLNKLHHEFSTHFKQQYETFTFSERIKKLHGRKNVTIFTAFDEDVPVGYCLVSIDAECGEIDSLFVAPEFRNQGIGESLVKKALQWLNERHCTIIDILVAEGNEKVFSFYERFGFKPRATLLRLLDKTSN